MSGQSDFQWPRETFARTKPTIGKLLVSCILLVVLHFLEEPITRLLSLAVGAYVAEYLYLALLVPLEILASYYVYKVYVAVSTPVIEASLTKLKVRSTGSTILLLNKILGIVFLITTAIWLLSSKIPFLYGYAQGVIASFSGIASLLVTLIVAMQMKEVAGNFLAGLVIKSSDVISEGDYIKLDSTSEYVRVEKIDHTYSRVVNHLNEEAFVPNLKFLVENFRKPFSRDKHEYVDVRFDLSYNYHAEQVEQDVKAMVARFNGRGIGCVQINEFLVVVVALKEYSVIYELRVKPSTPVFPQVIQSDFRRLLLEKYGENLATPMLLNIRK